MKASCSNAILNFLDCSSQDEKLILAFHCMITLMVLPNSGYFFIQVFWVTVFLNRVRFNSSHHQTSSFSGFLVVLLPIHDLQLHRYHNSWSNSNCWQTISQWVNKLSIRALIFSWTWVFTRNFFNFDNLDI